MLAPLFYNKELRKYLSDRGIAYPFEDALGTLKLNPIDFNNQYLKMTKVLSKGLSQRTNTPMIINRI